MPNVLSAMIWRFAALPVALGIAAAQTPAPTWKEFSLGPARPLRDARPSNVRQGFFYADSISLKSLIGIATGVTAARVDGPEWLEKEHYAVSATLSDESRLRLRTRSPDDPHIIEEFQSLLTQELAQRFLLDFHREERENREYSLQPAPGRRLRLHAPTEPTNSRVDFINSPFSPTNRLDALNVSIRTIGNWLQNYLDEPVRVAETLPAGNYDFHLQWKTKDQISLFVALKDQLGVELVSSMHRMEHIVVDRVERPPSLAASESESAPAPAPVAAPDSSIRFTPTELKRDLRVLRDALEEGHPGLYRFTPKPELDRQFDRVTAQLIRPLTALEFYRALAPAVAAIKCGHTSLLPSRAIQQRLAAEPLLPVEAAVLGGKVYVARDFSEEGQLAGAEILSINGVSADRILRSMLAVVHGDGDSATAGPYALSHNRGFARNLYLIAGLQSPFRLRYSLHNKIAETTINGNTLNVMGETETNRYPEIPRIGNAVWKVLDGGTTGVLKIRSFDGKAEDGTPLSDFFERVFNEANARGVTRMILDVRDNGGGQDELGRRLFAYFAGQPFRYYRDLIVNQLRFKFFRYVPNPDPLPQNIDMMMELGSDKKYHFVGHPNWGIQQPATPHFGGKVVVLMNGGSFSATCEFLSELHHRGGATFIGEETGGGYYGNTSGDAATIVLPRSKLMLPIQLVGYYMAIDGTEQGAHGIRPDHLVMYSIEDVLAGRDKAMEAALAVQ